MKISLKIFVVSMWLILVILDCTTTITLPVSGLSKNLQARLINALFCDCINLHEAFLESILLVYQILYVFCHFLDQIFIEQYLIDSSWFCDIFFHIQYEQHKHKDKIHRSNWKRLIVPFKWTLYKCEGYNMLLFAITESIAWCTQVPYFHFFYFIFFLYFIFTLS